MTATMYNEKLLDRLSKIKRSAEGEAALGNEAAAQAFAELLNRLLLDNKLEMTDLEFDQFEKEQPVGRHFIDYAKYPDVKLRRRRIEWVERLAQVIAGAHFCRILVHKNSSRITLVGRPDDCAVVEYLFVTLQRAAEKLSQTAYEEFWWNLRLTCDHCGMKMESMKTLRASELAHEASTGHAFHTRMDKAAGFRVAFLDAFISRLFARFDELRKAKEGESQALVRFNRSDAAAVAWIAENVKGKATGLTQSHSWNVEGRARGKAAADKIELRANAMKGGERNGQLRG